MILAVSSFNKNSYNNFVNVTNVSNQPKNRFISLKQVMPIAFTGNLTKLGKNLIGDESAKLGGKAKRFVEEITQSIGSTLRKWTGGNELPLTKKPLIAAGYPENTANFLNELSNLGIDPGSVKIDSVGGLSWLGSTALQMQ